MPAQDPAKRRSAIQNLRQKREARNFNAEPFLRIDATGVCRINTGRMSDRSQREIFNYAFIVNRYIQRQRGRKIKIKGTATRRRAQATFCRTVRSVNAALFGVLNRGKSQTNKLFSVVAHLPDECIEVRRQGESHNQVASTGRGGIGLAPGWMPMTVQANGLVAKIGNQTLRSTGQPDGPYITKILVDDLEPDCALEIDAVTSALGTDPFDTI